MKAPATSLTQNVRPFSLDSHVLKIVFWGENPFFVLADGRISDAAKQKTLRPHQDGVLVAAATPNGLVTGGDDGRVFLFPAKGGDVFTAEPVLIAEEKNRWIEAVALSHQGAIAWSAGKKVKIRCPLPEKKRANQKTHAHKTPDYDEALSLEMPSTPQGLAFAPKGLRLAIAHIDGATCWYPQAQAEPERFTWKGPHIDICFSPDNRFLITSMLENQLHGWGLTDKSHLRMSGYPAKPRAFSWSHDGLWFATSGAEGAIIWPFAQDGPAGKAPREGGIRPAKVTAVAFHPHALVLAIGYEDGWVLLVRLTDQAEILVRTGSRAQENQSGGNERKESKEPTAITALAWDAKGNTLAFGAADGEAGLLTLTAR